MIEKKDTKMGKKKEEKRTGVIEEEPLRFEPVFWFLCLIEMS